MLIHVSYKGWQGYESGDNVPGGKVLQSLAGLGFNINWLLTGEGPMRAGEGMLAEPASTSAPFANVDLITEIVEAVETLFQEHGLSLPPKKKGEHIGLLYEEVLEDRSKRSSLASRALRLIKLAS
jgi:hypothetical protein